MKEIPPFKEAIDLQKKFFEELNQRYKTLDKIFQSFGIKEFNDNVLPLVKNLFQPEINNLYRGLEGLDNITSPETKQEMETVLKKKIEDFLKKIDEMIRFLTTDFKNQTGVINDIYNFLREKINNEIKLIVAQQHYPRLTKEESEMIMSQFIAREILKILAVCMTNEKLKGYKDVFEIFKTHFQAVAERKEPTTNLQAILWLTLFLSILKIKFKIDHQNIFDKN